MNYRFQILRKSVNKIQEQNFHFCSAMRKEANPETRTNILQALELIKAKEYINREWGNDILSSHAVASCPLCAIFRRGPEDSCDRCPVSQHGHPQCKGVEEYSRTSKIKIINSTLIPYVRRNYDYPRLL